jgi:heterodisulfide reductase subunit A
MVLVVGGGLAGAAAAKELAASGRQVMIAEASDTIGGKVRGYGCKATDLCNNCGVCLTKNLWQTVENNDLIDIKTGFRLTDLRGTKGSYKASLKSGSETCLVENITDVIIATGFKDPDASRFDGFVEISDNGTGGIIPGSDIEKLLSGRGGTELFEKAPGSVCFIQCFGSRDKKEHTMYCSRICCAYSSRAAKVIKQYYPDTAITFFYMEMQQVKCGGYFDELKELGIDFIKCRPIKAGAGTPAYVEFDNPETGKREKRTFDLIVLSDGIRPADDAARIAEICGLGQTEDGFIKYVKNADDPKDTGIYITGCAGGPKRIDEVYAESAAVAKRLIFGE